MATLALNAGEWFRRGRLLIFCAPENTGSILAHRSSSSTYRRVQFCATTSASMGLSAGGSPWECAYLGSIAAGLQVARLGNVPLQQAALERELLG